MRLAAPLGLFLCCTSAALCGPLDPPPGPITPTHKTLTEVEPRTLINATNTPGDAGTVFRINRSGSYYLGADVQVTAGKYGITIDNGAAPNVTIDLNGFTIRGTAGSITGIRTTLVAGGTTLSIRNGSILSFDGDGMNVYAQALSLEDVSAEFNLVGFRLSGNAANVDRCRAFWNDDDGFNCQFSNGVMTRCVSDFSGGDGFEILNNLTVRDCSATTNTRCGLRMLSGNSIERCLVAGAGEEGMRCGSRNILRENSVGGAGGSIANGAAILITGQDNRVEGNHVSFSDLGVKVSDVRNLIIRNTSRQNFGVTHFDIVAGNSYGPIADVQGMGDISANPATAHPMANLGY